MMVSATIPQIEASKPATLVSAAAGLSAKAEGVSEAMDKARRAGDEYAHHSKGPAETARRERVLLEKTAGSAVAQQLMGIASALDSFGGEMDAKRTSLLNLVASARESHYTVHDDGSVSYEYFASVPGLAEQAQRQAAQYCSEISSLMGEYGRLDDALAKALGPQTDALDKLAKGESEKVVGAADDPGSWKEKGRQDAEAVNRGNLSEQERRRIVADLVANGLTPEQAEAKASGKDVALGKDQSAYLSQFYQDVKTDKLEAFSEQEGKRGDALGERAIADGLYTVTSPKTKFADGHSGGMDKAPKDARQLFDPAMQMNVDVQPQLSKLADMLGRSSDVAAQGSALNWKLMEWASGQAFGHDEKHDPGGGLTDHRAQDASHILQTASRDHASAMQVLDGLDPDGNFDPARRDKIVAGLLDKSWDGHSEGVQSFLGWIHDQAVPGDPPGPGGADGENYRATEAGRAARGLADVIINEHSFADGSNLHERFMANHNPAVTQAIGNALAPYQPELAHADTGSTQTRGFGVMDQPNHFDNARKVFAVIDSDKTAAQQFNAQALTNAQLLEEQYAQAAAHGENQSSKLRMAGAFEGLVKGGLNDEAAYRAQHMGVSQEQAHKDAGIGWDMAKSAASKVIGMIPVVGGVLSFGMDELNGYTKDYANPSPGHVPPQQPRLDLTNDTMNDAAYYNMAQGLIQPGQPVPPQLSAFVDPATGQLKSFDQIASEGHEGAFSDAVGDYLRSQGVQDGTLAKSMVDFDDMRNHADGTIK